MTSILGFPWVETRDISPFGKVETKIAKCLESCKGVSSPLGIGLLWSGHAFLPSNSVTYLCLEFWLR